MRTRFAVLTLTLFCGSRAEPALSYELATHAALTYNAYEQSALVSDSNLVRDLGIYPVSAPFGAVYYDFSGSTIYPRQTFATFEDKIIAQNGVQPLSLAGWLLRGAIREDDYIGSDAPNPKDDPYNTGAWADNRPLNHFYDPIH